MEMAEISLAEARECIPVIATDGLDSAFFILGDGMTDPTDTTRSPAKGARQGGVRIVKGVTVERIERAGRPPVPL